MNIGLKKKVYYIKEKDNRKAVTCLADKATFCCANQEDPDYEAQGRTLLIASYSKYLTRKHRVFSLLQLSNDWCYAKPFNCSIQLQKSFFSHNTLPI